jgi:hypothetical protein
MDLIRKLGTAIVFIIPTFVFSGLVWDWFHSWVVVFIMMIIMGFVYFMVITGRFLTKPE